MSSAGGSASDAKTAVVVAKKRVASEKSFMIVVVDGDEQGRNGNEEWMSCRVKSQPKPAKVIGAEHDADKT